ncbi:hypothetical protein WJX84_005371, partial [Apatococcus fuscideae]
EMQEQVQQHKAQWDQLVGRATDLESALEQWQAAYADIQQQLDASQASSAEAMRDKEAVEREKQRLAEQELQLTTAQADSQAARAELDAERRRAAELEQ